MIKPFVFLLAALSAWFAPCVAQKNSRTADADYPAGLPAALKKPAKDGPLPLPAFESGKTKVRVHYLHEGAGQRQRPEVMMHVNTLLGDQESFALNFDGGGTATVELHQNGSAYAMFMVTEEAQAAPMGVGTLWIAPGEATDIFIDGRVCAYARELMRWEEANPEATAADTAGMPRPNPHGYIYTTGRYADLNRFMSQYRYKDFWDWADIELSMQASGDAYADSLRAHYLAWLKRIEAKPWHKMYRAYSTANLRLFVMQMITEPLRMRAYQERMQHPIAPDDSISARIEGKHLLEIGELFDTSDASLLMAGGIRRYLEMCRYEWTEKAAAGSLQHQLRKTLELKADALNGRLALSAADMDTLGTFFATVLREKDAKARKLWPENTKLVTPTPNVPLDSLFQAIVAPHRGKVVVVDFWNTWCRPCLAAISEIEKLKTAAPASDEVVWIYIANETSPTSKYAEMIAGIKGQHFRLKEKEWRHIGSKDFPEMVGIPAYVLVDKTGKAEFRPDFDNHDTMMKAIKAACAAKPGRN